MDWRFLKRREFLVNFALYVVIFVPSVSIAEGNFAFEIILLALLASVPSYLIAYGYVPWMKIFAGGLTAWRLLLAFYLLIALAGPTIERLGEPGDLPASSISRPT